MKDLYPIIEIEPLSSTELPYMIVDYNCANGEEEIAKGWAHFNDGEFSHMSFSGFDKLGEMVRVLKRTKQHVRQKKMEDHWEEVEVPTLVHIMKHWYDNTNTQLYKFNEEELRDFNEWAVFRPSVIEVKPMRPTKSRQVDWCHDRTMVSLTAALDPKPKPEYVPLSQVLNPNRIVLMRYYYLVTFEDKNDQMFAKLRFNTNLG